MSTVRDVANALRNRLIAYPINALQPTWTSWRYPQAAESTGANAWAYPTRITAEDSSRASTSIAAPNLSSPIKASNFGFTFPKGTPVQIEIELRGIDNLPAATVGTLPRLFLGSDNATAQADFVIPQNMFDPQNVTLNYGLWGTSYTLDDIASSSFGFSFIHAAQSGTEQAALDAVRARIQYAASLYNEPNILVVSREQLPRGPHASMIQIVPLAAPQYVDAGLMRGRMRIVAFLKSNLDRIGDATAALLDSDRGILASRDAIATALHHSYLAGAVVEPLEVVSMSDPSGSPDSDEAEEQWMRASVEVSYGFASGFPHAAAQDDGTGVDRGQSS